MEAVDKVKALIPRLESVNAVEELQEEDTVKELYRCNQTVAEQERTWQK
jgi:hypothetical protein